MNQTFLPRLDQLVRGPGWSWWIRKKGHDLACDHRDRSIDRPHLPEFLEISGPCGLNLRLPFWLCAPPQKRILTHRLKACATLEYDQLMSASGSSITPSSTNISSSEKPPNARLYAFRTCWLRSAAASWRRPAERAS